MGIEAPSGANWKMFCGQIDDASMRVHLRHYAYTWVKTFLLVMSRCATPLACWRVHQLSQKERRAVGNGWETHRGDQCRGCYQPAGTVNGIEEPSTAWYQKLAFKGEAKIVPEILLNFSV